MSFLDTLMSRSANRVVPTANPGMYTGVPFSGARGMFQQPQPTPVALDPMRAALMQLMTKFNQPRQWGMQAHNPVNQITPEHLNQLRQHYQQNSPRAGSGMMGPYQPRF